MADYSNRIRQVCDFIQQNLDEELNMSMLSKVANLSGFHFHRIFTVYTGISLSRYVQLSRLKRASYQLAFEKHLRVTDIALRAGYDSHDGFTRAFRRYFLQTPSAFRQQADWEHWHTLFNFALPEGEKVMDVRIIDREEEKIAYLRHTGSPQKVLESAGRFIEWRKQSGLSPVGSSRTFGIPYADPAQVSEEDFRFDICGSVDRDVPDNAQGVVNGSIPGGRYAVARHHGSHDNIEDTVYSIYRDWLPGSGEEAGDFPVYFQYLNFIHEVDECDLQTDIFLLLK